MHISIITPYTFTYSHTFTQQAYNTLFHVTYNTHTQHTHTLLLGPQYSLAHSCQCLSKAQIATEGKTWGSNWGSCCQPPTPAPGHTAQLPFQLPSAKKVLAPPG